MSQRPREVRVPPPSKQSGRQCLGKHAHPKRKDAAVAAAAMRAKYGEDNLRPYRCDLCGHWHVGHWKNWEPKH